MPLNNLRLMPQAAIARAFADEPAPIQQVRRWAGRLRWWVGLGTGLALVALLAIVLHTPWRHDWLLQWSGLSAAQVRWSLLSEALAVGLAAVMVALVVAVVPVLLRMLEAWQQGLVLTLASAQALHRVGVLLVVFAVLRPVAKTLLGLILTLGNPPGQRMLLIGVSTDDVLVLVLSGLILVIGWVLLQASRIADEHAQFI